MKRFLVTLATCLVWTSVLTFWLSRDIPAQAQPKAQPKAQQTVRAQTIEVVNSTGQTVILLTTDRDGRGVIQVGDQFGTPMVSIESSSRNGPVASIWGAIVTQKVVFVNGQPASRPIAATIAGEADFDR